MRVRALLYACVQSTCTDVDPLVESDEQVIRHVGNLGVEAPVKLASKTRNRLLRHQDQVELIDQTALCMHRVTG